jgi:hypothetical protein
MATTMITTARISMANAAISIHARMVSPAAPLAIMLCNMVRIPSRLFQPHPGLLQSKSAGYLQKNAPAYCTVSACTYREVNA